MKKTHIYKVTIEDEARLERLHSVRLTRGRIVLLASLVFVGLLGVCFALVALTPLRRMLPGYVEGAEREQTIENMMRLDSLHRAYHRDRAYLDNLLTIMDTRREPGDSVRLEANPKPMTADSLLPTTKSELRFRAQMEEREKYNISVLAPLAADGMIFSPVSEEGVVSEASRGSKRAEIVLASGSPICAIADGTVVDTHFEASEGGYTVTVQHPRGFLSRYSRLPKPLVEEGDHLDSGQVMALQGDGSGRRRSLICLEIWHNGDELIPYHYLGR